MPGAHHREGYKQMSGSFRRGPPWIAPGPTIGDVQRLERLINLVAALLDADRPLTADDLRHRLPGYAESDSSFRRAFERDKEALRDLGIPVTVEPVDAADPGVLGYRIPKEDYYLRDPGLLPDELAAIHLASSAVRLDGASGVEALWKLGGEVVEGGPAPTVAALPGATHLATVFAAISARRRLAFSYRGRARQVDPWRLSFRNGHWYLAGLDHDAGEERMFRLDRIASDVDAVGGAGVFERPDHAGSQPPPWQMGTEEALTARLLVDAGQAAWAASHVGSEAVEVWRPDGSAVLTVRVTNREAFRSFVLGFLDHAEVLDPPELRADMVSWLHALAADAIPGAAEPNPAMEEPWPS